MRYIGQDYLNANPTWHVEDSAWKASEVVKMLERHELAPRTVCEVGCGAGEILVQLHRQLARIVTFDGYDIAPQAIELARARGGNRLRFIHADFTTMDTPPYDVMVVADVIEHIEDYYSFLRRLRPRATWKIFHIPLDMSVQTLVRVRPLLQARQSVGHLHYFFKASALATLDEAGYTVVDSFYTLGLAHPARAKTPSQRFLVPLRRALYAMRPDAAARLLGGYSLLVLAQ